MLRDRAFIPAALLAFALLASLASALPDGSTSVSGADCARGHSFRYSYTATAPKTVTAGEEFTVSLEFKLSSDTRVMRSPRTVEASLSGAGIEILSPSLQGLSPTASWRIKASKAGSLDLAFSTNFFIDGRDFHAGYKANYMDEVAVTVVVNEPTTITPPPGPVQNDTAPQVNPPQNITSPPPNGDEDGEDEDDDEGDEDDGTQTATGNETQTVTQDFEAALPAEPDQTSWYITRIVGLLAYLALFLSVLTALLKKVGVWAKSKALIMLFKYHHDVSLLSLALALFHGLSNVVDKFMWNLSLDKVLLPQFGSQNQNMIAIGVIAFYIMLAVVATSLGGVGMKKLGPKNWKYVHMASYAAFILVFIHSVILGTDVKSGGPISLLFWVSGLVILGVSLYLLIRKWTR